MAARRLTTLKPRLQSAASRLVVAQPGSWRTNKQTANQRGYNYAWQKARESFLLRHPFCAFCLRNVRIEATAIEDVILECADRGIAVPYANTVDHMDAHRGDMAVFWDKTRWQSLCASCHSSEKQRIEACR